ncbi:MAG TPA: hypothetical protein VFR20_02120 [Burkholderiaceae bacterium]|nr:hypothetical protein [Burkholderiaceae bacterium]
MTNDNRLALVGVIKATCQYVAENDLAKARDTIVSRYPFAPKANVGRSYGPEFMTKVFLRDGFIDRYKGTNLIFPPVLRLLSHYLPDDFPYHRNWKVDATHPAYWELLPTIDHVVPVARGGQDAEPNCVSCSMLTNSIKSAWTLDELGWQLQPAGDADRWDGMMGWFIKQVEQHPELLRVGEVGPYLKRWYGPAKASRG